MSKSKSNSSRIAKNTAFLYFRMLFSMAVTFYTSRVVLQALGVTDFGLYNVVGGVVSMFSFLNMAMTNSTQRYITFELGRGDMVQLNRVFTVSVNIHVLISLLVVLLGETVGLWLFYNKLTIPPERLTAAFWVLQISIFTTVVAVMSYPYNALIVAYERMSAFAYISILEVVLRLLVVFALGWFGFDKLIFYAVLIAGVQLFIRMCYSNYSSRHFPHVKYLWTFDRQLFRKMLSFAGWNLWGTLSAILYTQGINILLNIFFGPAVNASRAISVQAQNGIHHFSANFQKAVNPQITKSYASGDLPYMHSLIFRSAKFTFFLLFMLSLPVLLETPFVLSVWLHKVPDYSVIFLRIMLLTIMIDSTANPLMVSAAATGNVRRYQSIVGGLLLLIVPIAYIVLKLGGAPWTVFLVHLVMCSVAYVVRLFIIRPMIRLSLRQYFSSVVVRCVVVAVVGMLLPIAVQMLLPSSVVASVTVMAVAFVSSVAAMLLLGMDVKERAYLWQAAGKIVGKIRNK